MDGSDRAAPAADRHGPRSRGGRSPPSALASRRGKRATASPSTPPSTAASAGFCRRGEINLCDKPPRPWASHARTTASTAPSPITSPCRKHILYRLPEKTTFEQAAMVEGALDRGPTPRRARRSGWGDTAVVFGAGMIGPAGGAKPCAPRGCGQIIAVDLDPAKLELGAAPGSRRRAGDRRRKRQGRARRDRGSEAPHRRARRRPGLRGGRDRADGQSRRAQPAQGRRADARRQTSPPPSNFPSRRRWTRQLTLLGTCASAGEYPACLDMIAPRRGGTSMR